MIQTIGDDALAVGRVVAERQGSKLDSAVAELSGCGFKCASIARSDGNSTVFVVAVDVEPITSEDVHRSLDEWP